MTEAQLVERALAGDEGAMHSLYEANVDQVYRLTYRLTGDPDLAQEFTQDTFVRAFQRLDQFRGDAKLSTWLHAIGRSVTFNGLRKIKRLRKRELDVEEIDPDAGLLGAAPRRGVEPDARTRLYEAIDDLPDIYREVVVMHDVEGYTHEEIGEVLKVATGTSKARLSRARQMLREALSDFAEEFTA